MFSEFFPCHSFFIVFGFILILLGTLLPFKKKRYRGLKKKTLVNWVSENRRPVFYGILVLGVFLRTLNLEFFLVTDEPFYIYAAKQVYLGYEPYADFFFSQPPLEVYLTASSFKLFGLGLLQARLIPFIFSIASMILVYRISRRVYPKNPDYALLSFALFTLTHSMIVVPTQAILYSPMIFLGLSSTYFFIAGLEGERGFYLFGAGVLAGFSLWSKLSGGVFLVAEAVYILWFFRGKSLRLLIPLVTGFSLVSSFFFGYFYS
ncbi:MAG: hypothetical protein GF334_10820, partial [Candidatus Altiarchaeales archaeon]|nr:hypothetical protein [Candidatus Altiarchaeales archaeon]